MENEKEEGKHWFAGILWDGKDHEAHRFSYFLLLRKNTSCNEKNGIGSETAL